MTVDLSTARIFIRPGPTDLRKAVNGLTALVQEQMKGDPFSGSVYVFRDKGRKLLKAVWWDKKGSAGFGEFRVSCDRGLDR
jgi:transposase